MSAHPSPTPPDSAAAPKPSDSTPQWLGQQHWVPFVLPLAVFMLVGYFAPQAKPAPLPPQPAAAAADANQSPATDKTEVATGGWRLAYPWVGTLQIAATLFSMWLVRSAYLTVPWKRNFSSVIYGVCGGLLWILVCRWGLESQLLTAIGRADWIDATARPAFDPLTAFDGSPVGLTAFLAVRFAGLVVVVPIIEEFFVRGFLMRFIMAADWWTIPLGTVTLAAAVTATAYGVLAHPAEWIAALLWFSLITLLYARTRNLWACVIAHAVTNGMLGAYILIWRDWALW